jgi:hypothetical protein
MLALYENFIPVGQHVKLKRLQSKFRIQLDVLGCSIQCHISSSFFVVNVKNWNDVKYSLYLILQDFLGLFAIKIL